MSKEYRIEQDALGGTFWWVDINGSGRRFNTLDDALAWIKKDQEPKKCGAWVAVGWDETKACHKADGHPGYHANADDETIVWSG